MNTPADPHEIARGARILARVRERQRRAFEAAVERERASRTDEQIVQQYHAAMEQKRDGK